MIPPFSQAKYDPADRNYPAAQPPPAREDEYGVSPMAKPTGRMASMSSSRCRHERKNHKTYKMATFACAARVSASELEFQHQST